MLRFYVLDIDEELTHALRDATAVEAMPSFLSSPHEEIQHPSRKYDPEEVLFITQRDVGYHRVSTLLLKCFLNVGAKIVGMPQSRFEK